MEELLLSIESILIDAGEVCPDDYQNQFDWKKYMEYIEIVKKKIIEYNNFKRINKND